MTRCLARHKILTRWARTMRWPLCYWPSWPEAGVAAGGMVRALTIVSFGSHPEMGGDFYLI